MKTLAQLREHVWDFVDTDDSDISENLLNAWAKEGFDRIVRAVRSSPHFDAEYPLNGAAGDESVPFNATLESIEWVTCNGRLLDSLGQREAYDYFVSWDGFRRTGEPTHFSSTDRTIELWPTPSQDFDLVVHGWRKPVDWVTAASTPDFPEYYESALIQFMLYRAFGQQGLVEDGQIHRAEFESQVAEFVAWELQQDATQRPMVLNGGTRLRSRSGPAPLTFPVRMG